MSGIAFSRRTLLRGSAGLLAARAFPRSRTAAAAGLGPVGMVLHVHSSRSEGKASMAAQLANAADNGLDVVWFTDHDWRQLHYTFLTAHDLRSPDGGSKVTLKRIAGSGGSFSTAGFDPEGSTWAFDDNRARECMSGSLAGLTVTVTARPAPGQTLTVKCQGSRRTVSGPLPTAQRQFANAGRFSWQPASTLGRDAALQTNTLAFTGHGTFSDLTLDWGTPADPVAEQAASMPYVPAGLVAHVGTELSFNEHVGQYGGNPQLGDPDVDGPTLVRRVHQQGGVAVFAHPFGTSMNGGGVSPSVLAAKTARCVGSDAFGADCLEADYWARGGADIGQHWHVADSAFDAGLYLTTLGVSDDHSGEAWAAQANRGVTVAWATGASEAELCAAMLAGRCFTRRLGSGLWTVDLDVDGTCPMGSASVSTAQQRTLVVAGSPPPGGSFRVMQGVRTGSGVADAQQIARLGDGGAVQVDNTAGDSWLRVEVYDGNGNRVGSSNPVWLLRKPDPDVPAVRQA